MSIIQLVGGFCTLHNVTYVELKAKIKHACAQSIASYSLLDLTKNVTTIQQQQLKNEDLCIFRFWYAHIPPYNRAVSFISTLYLLYRCSSHISNESPFSFTILSLVLDYSEGNNNKIYICFHIHREFLCHARRTFAKFHVEQSVDGRLPSKKHTRYKNPNCVRNKNENIRLTRPTHTIIA